MHVPAQDSHYKCHGRKHVAHGTGEGWGSELQSSIVEILVYHWPASSIILHLLSFNRSIYKPYYKLIRSKSTNISLCYICYIPKQSKRKNLHEYGESHFGPHLPANYKTTG